MPELICF